VKVIKETQTANHAEIRAKKILRKDEYQRKLDRANTGLALAGLPLANGTVNLSTLQAFNSKALKLAQLCGEYTDRSRQISVLLWLGQRMCLLSQQLEDELCLKLCKLTVAAVEKEASVLCNGLGNVVALPIVGNQPLRAFN
jgi:hypothetical protein